MNAYQRFIVGLTADCVDFLRSENYEIDAEETARLVCTQIYPDQASHPDAWLARVQEVKVIVEIYLQSLETHAQRQPAN
jgi:hypothetical protein